MVLLQARRKPLWFLLIVGLCVLVPAGGMGQPPQPRTDYLGDRLPEGAVGRLGTARLRHPGAIRRLKFTEDGKSVISFGDNDMPMVWDVETGKRTRRDGVPRQLLFNQFFTSPDQKFIAAIREDATEIELRDKATGKPIMVRGNPALWSSVAFARDGKSLLAVSYDNVVTAWDIASGKETSKQHFGPARYFMKPILALDGSVLAGALEEDSRKADIIHFWDPLTGKEKHKPIPLSYGMNDWSLSDDGKRLTVQHDSIVESWEVETGEKTVTPKGRDHASGGILSIPEKKLAVIFGDENVMLRDVDKKVLWDRPVAPPNSAGRGLKTCFVNSLALSPDGKVVAAGTDNGYIELLDLATGERVGGSRLHPGFFSAPFQLVPGGKYAIVTMGSESVVWNMSEGRKARDFGIDSRYDIHIISPDGQSLLEGNRLGNAYKMTLQETLSGKELWALDDRYDSSTNARFSTDGQTLAICAWRERRQKQRVTYVSAKTGELIRTFQPHELNPPTNQTFPPRLLVAVSPEMTVATETGDQQRIQLWDPSTEKELWTWTMPAYRREHLQSIHFVPGGKYVIAEMSSRTNIKVGLFVLDAKTGKQLESIQGSDFQGVSSDGRFIAFHVSAGEKDYYCEVRDLQSEEAALKVKGAYNGCFSADSKIFACARDKTIEFYDLQTKQRLGPPRPHPARLWEMSFAPSGSILAATYNDSTVILWDALAPSR